MCARVCSVFVACVYDCMRAWYVRECVNALHRYDPCMTTSNYTYVNT